MLTLIETIITTRKDGYRYLNSMGRFRCDGCGGTVVMRMGDSRKWKSCGCRRTNSKTHGLYKHPLYNILAQMKQRCSNQKCKAYINYGGRGITVCLQWSQSFYAFYTWAMEAGWRIGLTIDRRNNNGHYTPNNCRFVTRKVQARNRRSNKITTADAEEIRRRVKAGERQSVIAGEFNLASSNISNIINNQLWA